MIGDFNRVFQSDDLYNASIPDALQQVIDKDLPKGLSYKKVEGDYYIVSSDDGKLNLKISFELPVKFKDELEKGVSLTQEDLSEYLYNSQKHLVVQSSDGMIEINGKRMKMDYFISNPFSDIEIKDSRMLIFPSEMNEKYDLRINCPKAERKIHFKRIPNDDLYVKKYVSDGSALKIEVYIDRKKINNVEIKVNLDVFEAEDVDDVLSSYYIMEAFAKNEISIEQIKVDLAYNNPFSLPPDSILDFWMKAKKIEELIGEKFDIKQGVRGKDAKNIYALYRTIVEHKPFREYADALYLNGSKPDEAFMDSIKTAEGFYFEYYAADVIEVLGRKIQIYSLIGIFNAKLSEDGTKIDNDNYQFKIISMNGKRLYRSFIYYLDKDEIEDGTKSHRELLEDAVELDTIEYV